jgi:uncharacterized membrane protein
VSELSDAKIFGGIGAVLSTFGTFIPWAGFVVSIIGFILEAVAIYKISRVLYDEAVFKNYLISIILAIVGIFAAVLLGITTIITSVVTGRLFSVILSIMVVLLILCITLTISAVFLKKSFDIIAKKLNISMFSTAALLNLIGAATVIIIIGIIIVFVANIIKIVAFFSLPETAPPPPPPLPPSSM